MEQKAKKSGKAECSESSKLESGTGFRLMVTSLTEFSVRGYIKREFHMLKIPNIEYFNKEVGI